MTARGSRGSSRVDFAWSLDDIAPQSGPDRTIEAAQGKRLSREGQYYQGKSVMYAVIKTGGKQYRVAADEVLTVEKLAGDAGATVEFTEVLMVAGTGEAKVGKPTLAGAKVVAEVVEQGRADKVIAFKKRRRKNSRRKRGHRQHQTTVRIKEIVGA
jgi:large subunit ribosomal protein L21